MSDPFDQLRNLPADGQEPDVGAIRRRARSIQARRYTALGATAGIGILVLAVVVVANRPSPRATSLASKAAPEATPQEAEAGTDTTSDSAAAIGEAPAATAAAQTGAKAPAGRAAGGAGPNSAGAPAAVRAPASGNLEVSLKLSRTTIGPGEQLQMTLTACNRTSENVQAEFPTAQRQDYEISRGGSVVWHWSHGRAFAQMFGAEQWIPGECRVVGQGQWTATDDNGRTVTPGAYDVVGVFTSTQPKRTAAQRVCYVACT